jgi:hypothetical protein
MKAWHPLYAHYRGNGLSIIVILFILVRRISRTAWSIYPHKTEFEPKQSLETPLPFEYRIREWALLFFNAQHY